MSLIAWYPLNKDTLDYSGNENHATNTGLLLNNGGKIGRSYKFDGVENYIVAPRGIFTFEKDLTIHFWVNFSNYGDYQNVLSTCFNGSGLEGWWIEFGSARGLFIYDDGSLVLTDNVKSVRSIVENIWHHFVLTRKDGFVQAFLNEELIGESTYEGTIGTDTHNLMFGKYATNLPVNVYPFRGMLNDVRIYDHCLTTKEISELSKAKVLHYSFNYIQEPTENLFRPSKTSRSFELINGNGVLAYGEPITINGLYVDRLIKSASHPTGYDSYRLCIPSKDGVVYTVSYKAKINSGSINALGCHFNGGNAHIFPKKIGLDTYQFSYTDSVNGGML